MSKYRLVGIPAAIVFAIFAVIVSLTVTNSDQPVAQAASLPALPSGWPSTLQLGMSDSPGGAAAMKATTSFGFRYQYLSAGVNTGNGWANWNSNGAFATYYIQDSVANNITPVFTYYMIRQSNPGASMGESQGVLANLQNTSTMSAYWNDLKLFFQKAGAFPNNLVVLQVEPDMWGYVQQAASGDNATSVSASVASSGLSELSGLPNNMSGFAKAVVKLRDLYAPNVKLGYHLSYWGTGTDPLYSKPSDSTIDQLAGRSAAFYNSLAANFDVSFAEFSDRDSAFYQYQYGNPNTWWTAADFARNVRYLSDFSSATGKRIVMWQIPLGNTKMLAMNNTWGHYQDNRPEWLLDDGAGARVNLQAYVNAGVVAFLFGGGAGGTTCACDADGDGVTNPAAINGNTGVSLSADDDGGYFRAKAKAYYQAGAMSLSGGTSPTNTPTATPTSKPTNTPTTKPTNTPDHETHQYAYAEAGYADTDQNCPAHRDPDQHSATATRMDDQRERFVVEHQAGPNRADLGQREERGIDLSPCRHRGLQPNRRQGVSAVLRRPVVHWRRRTDVQRLVERSGERGSRHLHSEDRRILTGMGLALHLEQQRAHVLGEITA